MTDRKALVVAALREVSMTRSDLPTEADLDRLQLADAIEGGSVLLVDRQDIQAAMRRCDGGDGCACDILTRLLRPKTKET